MSMSTGAAITNHLDKYPLGDVISMGYALRDL